MSGATQPMTPQEEAAATVPIHWHQEIYEIVAGLESRLNRIKVRSGALADVLTGVNDAARPERLVSCGDNGFVGGVKRRLGDLDDIISEIDDNIDRIANL